MSEDFYAFVDSGDPAPDNRHLDNPADGPTGGALDTHGAEQVRYATRIAVYDDLLSTPRVLVINPHDVRSYLEEITNTVYRCMKEQGGTISLMVIREIVENFIHAHFAEPIISILDGGNTVRFADQGPGIEDKERAFEFGVTSADREKKRYIRGTGAGFPMVQQYLENAGGAVSIEDNLGQGTVITVTVDPARTAEVEGKAARGAAVRGAAPRAAAPGAGTPDQAGMVAPGMSASGMAAVPEAAGQVAAMPQAAPQPYPGYQAYQPYRQQQAAMGYGLPPQQAQAAWGGYYPQRAMTQQAAWPQGAMVYPPQQVPGMYGYQQVPAPGMQPMGGYPAMPGAAPMASGPHVTERGRQAMGYLAQFGICGPTDLAQAFGSSNATWSRELESLAAAGMVIKQGQKRILTDMGRMWIDQELTGGTAGAGMPSGPQN